MTFQVLLVELDSVDSTQFILLSFVVFRYLFLPFPFYFRGAGVVPISCVLNLSTSTFFGWISPLEFMVHSIHSCSRTTRRSACHTRRAQNTSHVASRGFQWQTGCAQLESHTRHVQSPCELPHSDSTCACNVFRQHQVVRIVGRLWVGC